MHRPPTATPVAGALLDLLWRFTRHQINRLLWESERPMDYLASGDLARDLGRAFGASTSPPAAHPVIARSRSDDGAEDGLVCCFDPDFPPLLRHIPDPPLILHYTGNLSALAQRTVAIVGARRCTAQGEGFAAALAGELVRAGLVIVSGLAMGIDGAAHRGALAGCGQTAAFLGSGLGKVYPAGHTVLARSIIDNAGVLCTEYSALTPPLAHQFPERNRMISGASQAVIVVEASERSGSLITARLALEQGRDVMAVPGPVHSRTSRGCFRLIQQGAALITCAEDVLQNMGVECSPPDVDAPPLREISGPALQVLDRVREAPASLDELLSLCEMPVEAALAILSELEVAGFVRQAGGGYIATS